MRNDQVHVIHVADGLRRTAGGPSTAIVGMAEAIAQVPGISLSIVSSAGSDSEDIAPSHGLLRNVRVSHTSPFDRVLGFSLRRHVSLELADSVPAVIHTHGLWRPNLHWACTVGRARGTPVVIQTHGMLGAVSLANRSLRKRVALGLYQRADIEEASTLIATAEAEFEQIRQAGIRKPVAVIPFGATSPVGSQSRRESQRRDPECRNVLYLSRVTPRKGLPELIRAWAALRPEGWRLRIAGPDEGGYLDEIRALGRELRIESSIDFLGEVRGQTKEEAFSEADLFVLPSEHENFGIVVLEALQRGVPVITTTAAPWQDLVTTGSGWWIDFGVEPLRTTLARAVALDDEERKTMGARARSLSLRFDWRVLARATVDVYRWALGSGPRPECVRLD